MLIVAVLFLEVVLKELSHEYSSDEFGATI